MGGELEAAIERYHAAAAEFIKGNPEPQKAVFSRGEDVSLVNPLGLVGCGWVEVEAAMERGCAPFSKASDGEVLGFERLAQQVTAELAYVVEIERYRARFGATVGVASIDLRVTSVLRPENGTWKVVHRHADAIPQHDEHDPD
jgi:ketosteroid isomerase-like protein